MTSLKKIEKLKLNIEKVIVGKSEIVDLAIIALLARGHLLIEDVPGVGKTTLARSIARSINCSFKRVQFTSDLLPSDILGVSVFDPKEQSFKLKRGPIFSNIILADEINRANPKTQSSLLEAMNDYQVSVENQTILLPAPFMVIATQNPMEYHGTYPLPESQLDRFLMRTKIGYPERGFEEQILKGESTKKIIEQLEPVLTAEEVIELQELTQQVKIDDSLISYLLDIVEKTRKSEMLALGVSPRGALHLHKAAQGGAVINGRDYCIPDDIKKISVNILSHRVIVNTRLKGFGRRQKDAENIILEIINSISVPE